MEGFNGIKGRNPTTLNPSCDIYESKKELEVEFDESLHTKPYVYLMDIFIILAFLGLFSFLIYLTPLLFIFFVLSIITGFWFDSRLILHENNLIDIDFNIDLKSISIQKFHNDVEEYDNISFKDIKNIALFTEYINNEGFHLGLELKDNKIVEFFNGNLDDCWILGKRISNFTGIPIIYKTYIRKFQVCCIIMYGIFFGIAFLFGDLVAQTLFLLGLIFSNLIFFGVLKDSLGKNEKMK